MKNKFHIFFRRVSSANQDLATQIEFDRPYREACEEDKILIMNEDDTSANKLRVAQRPKIPDIIQMIKEDKVEKVYAYDRTRLFRDYYEAQDFCNVCNKHNVNIIFTSTSNGHMPFTGDLFIEGILNLFGDIEGKNIARRTSEARRKYPPRKFGYRKTEDKKYHKLDETRAIIEEFFEELKNIESMETLIIFLKKYRQAFGKGRTDENLMRMASDPFYAGYDLHEGEYKLPHVDPFLSKESFLQIQKQIGPLMKTYETHVKGVQSLYTNFPKCGYCHTPLRPRLTADRSASSISCSQGHDRVSHTTQTINEAVNETIKKVLVHLDAEQLVADSNYKLKEIRKTLKQEMSKISKQIKQASDDILFSDEKNYDLKWEETEQYLEMQELYKIYRHYEEELNEKHKLLVENRQLYQLTLEAIQKQLEMNISALANLLINEVRLFENTIEIDVNKFDYVRNFDTEIILHQEVIL